MAKAGLFWTPPPPFFDSPPKMLMWVNLLRLNDPKRCTYTFFLGIQPFGARFGPQNSWVSPQNVFWMGIHEPLNSKLPGNSGTCTSTIGMSSRRLIQGVPEKLLQRSQIDQTGVICTGKWKRPKLFCWVLVAQRACSAWRKSQKTISGLGWFVFGAFLV